MADRIARLGQRFQGLLSRDDAFEVDEQEVGLARGSPDAVVAQRSDGIGQPGALAGIVLAGFGNEGLVAKRGGGNDMQVIIAQSYLQQGKPAEAAKIYQDMVNKNPNNVNALQNLAAAQSKMGDKKGSLATIQKLIRLDPTPARWRALLVDMKSGSLSRDAKLGVYHLMRETGNLTTAADVQEFAKLAIVAGQAGVAADAVKAAGASGVLPAGDPMTTKLVEAAAKRQTAALAAAPAGAKNPATALAAGNAYLGAGQYPQAIAAFTTAQKGPNAGEAALFKGIAQVRSGQTAAARQTFKSVPAGPNTEVAGLWDLYASTK